MSDAPLDFAISYADSVDQFAAVCARENLECREFSLDLQGPAGERLSTRTAYIGQSECSRLLILNCGTHGVEGLAGSACMLSWLARRYPRTTDDVGILLVHLINPWGTAWRRRQTENNVDLNRNFVDFSAALPVNRHYEELSSALTPRSIQGLEWDDARRRIDQFRKERGAAALAEAVFRGQYYDEAGLGFGGNQATWSNLTFRTIVSRHAAHARHVAFIDFHTGLGPYAHGSLLSTEPPGSEEFSLAVKWYGDSVVSLKARDRQMPYDIQGDIAGAVKQALPLAKVAAISLEFGTFDLDRFMVLQIRDCWLQRYGSPFTQEAERIRVDLQEFFCPPARDWQGAIVDGGSKVIQQAMAGLTSIS